MNVRKLLYEDGAMAENLMSRNIFAGHRLHLRHQPNLFDFHRFLSGQSDFSAIHFWSVFEGEKPLGAGGFLEFPLNLPLAGVRCFYNSDSAVEEGARKQGIFQKLMEQQREFFGGFKGLPFSWGIEQHPGVLDGMKAYVEKFGGGEVHFTGNTCAYHIHLDQAPGSAGSQKILLRDMSVTDREKFMGGLKAFGSQSPFFPRVDISFFDRVLKVDSEAYVVVLRESGGWAAGLLAVNLQPLRQYFENQTPLKTQHWSLVWAEANRGQELLQAAHREAFQQNFQLAVVRDVPIAAVKAFNRVAMSPRRVFAMMRQSDHQVFQKVLPTLKNVALDAVFS